MDQHEGINGVFAELERSGSLHAALAEGVRLACRIVGASVGSLSVAIDAADEREEWFVYESGTAPDNDTAGRGRRQIVVPLNCGDKAAGRLNLFVPKHLDAQSVRSDLTGLTAALGVLIVAAEGDICRRIPGVLGRSAFQARVHSELSRARRRDESFSLLHADVAGLKASRAGAASGPWAATSLLAESLSPRLRDSDIVGLMSPNRLTILLTTTGRAGARIAARRIEQLTREFIESSQSELHGCDSPHLFFRTFPDDADEIESFCRPSSTTGDSARAAICEGAAL